MINLFKYHLEVEEEIKKSTSSVLSKCKDLVKNKIYIIFSLLIVAFFFIIPFLENSNNGLVDIWLDKMCMLITHITGSELLVSNTFLAFIIYFFIFFLALVAFVVLLYFIKLLVDNNDHICAKLSKLIKEKISFDSIFKIFTYIFAIIVIGAFFIIPYFDSSSASESNWFIKISTLVADITNIEIFKKITPIAFIIYVLIYSALIGIIFLTLLSFKAVTEKFIREKEKFTLSLQGYLSFENISKIIKYIAVFLTISLFFIIPYYDSIITIISEWFNRVRYLSQKIYPSAPDSMGYHQALIFYTFLFTVLAIIVISVLTISKKNNFQ